MWRSPETSLKSPRPVADAYPSTEPPAREQDSEPASSPPTAPISVRPAREDYLQLLAELKILRSHPGYRENDYQEHANKMRDAYSKLTPEDIAEVNKKLSSPIPGSDEAHALGCLCPTIDNHYGRGRYGNGARYGWFIDARCPIVHLTPTTIEIYRSLLGQLDTLRDDPQHSESEAMRLHNRLNDVWQMLTLAEANQLQAEANS